MATATATAMPPTPQQSFSHMAPAASPPASQSGPQPNGGMPGYGHNYNMSFDSQNGGQAMNYNQNFQNGPVANPGYARSFGDGSFGGRGYDKPQIYTVRTIEGFKGVD